jgi:hypothetical protein
MTPLRRGLRAAQLGVWLWLHCAVVAAQAVEAEAAPEAAPAPEAVPEAQAAPEAEAAPAPVGVPEAAPAPAPEPEPEPVSVSVSAPAPVPDEEGWSDSSSDDAGFGGDAAATVPEAAATLVPPAELSAGGFFRTQQGFWLERPDEPVLAKARQNLDLHVRYKKPFRMFGKLSQLRVVGALHLEYDFAYLIEPERFDDATLDTYRSQVIVAETYAALSHGPLELTVGRQIVAWGQGELINVLDVVNPRDVREPGIADLVDIRLAVLASRAALFFGAHRLEAMVIHEAYFGLLPAPLSPFSPLRYVFLQDPVLATALETKQLRFEHEPEHWSQGTQQFLGRWEYKGPGLDLALYYANILSREGMVVLPQPAEFAEDSLAITLNHPRYNMLGHAGALPLGDLILRWELGFNFEQPLMATTPDPNDSVQPRTIRRHRAAWMAGLTYAGIDHANIGLEYGQSRVLDAPQRDPDSGLELLLPVEQPLIGVRWNHDFLRETLKLTVAATVFGIWEYTGWLGRIELDYALVDALHVGVGYVTYHPTDDFSVLYGLTTHDRVFVSARWDFVAE